MNLKQYMEDALYVWLTRRLLTRKAHPDVRGKYILTILSSEWVRGWNACVSEVVYGKRIGPERVGDGRPDE